MVERTVDNQPLPEANQLGEQVGRFSELQPSATKKTPLMLEVEQRFAQPGESLAELLKRLYVDENRTLKAIVREIVGQGVSICDKTIRNWMSALHPEIPIKSIQEWNQDSQFQQYRISRLRAVWQDPERKKEIVAKIHRPGSDSLRSQKKRKYWIDHPEKLSETIRRLHEARERSYLERRRVAFGGDPKEVLGRLVKDFSLSEIALQVELSPGTLRRYCIEFNIEANARKHNRRRLTDEEIAERRQMIQKAIETGVFGLLTQRQQEALRALYLTGSWAPTQAEVARNQHVEREGIRQLEARGLKNLKKRLKIF